MSDLCVLAASLLVQGKTPGWKLDVPPRPFWTTLFQPRSEVDQVCEVSALPASSSPVSLHRPEFSRSVRTVAAASVIQATPRPVLDRQLYVQRLAALQIGQLYTRLSADSFQPLWSRASRQPKRADWVNLLRHEAKAVATGQGKAKLSVLLGDSHAQWFPVEQLSRDRFWLNQGLAGDTTADLLARLSAFDQTRPDAIYIAAGTQDLRQGVADAEILTNMRQMIRQLRARHPDAQVYIHAILPTRLAALPAHRIDRLNADMARLAEAENARFINLQPALTDSEGKLQAQLTTDGLHLNPEGYQIWRMALWSLS
jgi:lysophospholipase L1-like esterase